MLSAVRRVALRPAVLTRISSRGIAGFEPEKRIAGTVIRSTAPVDMNLGRTPERTAELERLAEEHNGFLFGEVPLAEGESRQWADWEYSYYPLMTSAVVLYSVAYIYR